MTSVVQIMQDSTNLNPESSLGVQETQRMLQQTDQIKNLEKLVSKLQDEKQELTIKVARLTELLKEKEIQVAQLSKNVLKVTIDLLSIEQNQQSKGQVADLESKKYQEQLRTMEKQVLNYRNKLMVAKLAWKQLMNNKTQNTILKSRIKKMDYQMRMVEEVIQRNVELEDQVNDLTRERDKLKNKTSQISQADDDFQASQSSMMKP